MSAAEQAGPAPEQGPSVRLGPAGLAQVDQRPWAIRRLQSMSRRTRILIGVVTVGVVVAGGLGVGLTETPQVTQQVSNLGPAPAFNLPSVTDPARTVDLARYAGHPIILNFWGSWCTVCRQEMPLLARTADSVDGRIRFLGVDLEDSDRSAAVAMMERYRTPYPSGYDPNDVVADRYRLIGTPTTVFINAKGDIIGKVLGVLSPSALQFWVRHLE